MTESNPSYGPYDAECPPPLVFHQWAELSAKLARRTRDERKDILEQAGVDARLFEACNAFWLGALADQVAADNYRLAEIYANMCVREMQTRATTPSAFAKPTQLERAVENDVDATALLVALPDETALPFQRPERLTALAKEQQEPVEPEAPSQAGDTQFVPAVQIEGDPLPFRKSEGRGSS